MQSSLNRIWTGIFANFSATLLLSNTLPVSSTFTYMAACGADGVTRILKAKNAHAAIAAQAKKKKEEQNRQSSRTEIAKAITDAEGLTPELVSLLIEKVYIFPDKRIEIAYKVNDLFD